MRVHVVCFGNLLAGDDGFGIHVFQRLAGRTLDRPGLRVALFDAGLSGLSALRHFEGCDAVIVVDALGFAGCVGRLTRLALADVAAPREAFSAHALDLNHLVHVLPIVFEGRRAPEVIVLGAQIHPPAGSFSMALSPAVEEAAYAAVLAIEHELTTRAECVAARALRSTPRRRPRAGRPTSSRRRWPTAGRSCSSPSRCR